MKKKNNYLNAKNIIGIILILLLIPISFGFILSYHVTFNSIIYLLINIVSYFLINSSIYILLIAFILLSMFVNNKTAAMIIKIVTFLLMGIIVVYSFVYDITFIISVIDGGISDLFLVTLSTIASLALKALLMIYVISTLTNNKITYICNTILYVSLSIFSLFISLALISNINLYTIIEILYLVLLFITRLLIALYFYFYK